MIDIFLKIIDDLEKLTRLKIDFDRKMFEDHIDPIYKDLKLIVDNYHSILKDVKNSLQETDFSRASTNRIVSMLIERRQEYGRVRGEIKRYSKTLKENNNRDDIQKFAIATFDLLNVEPVTMEMIENITGKQPPKATNATISLIWDLTRIPITPSSQKGVLGLVKFYSKEIDRHWDIVSQYYFELRTKYLK